MLGDGRDEVAGLRLLGVVQADELQDTFDSIKTYGPATSVNTKRGVFVFANSISSPVVQGDLGYDVYVQDNQTVAHSTTHSLVAGIFVGFYQGNTSWVIVDSTAASFAASAATS
jgi:hypothetical protein